VQNNDTSSDNKKTVKAAISNTVSNGIVMVFALIMIPITTRILSATDLGVATNFFSVRNICLNIFTLATYMTVNKGMLEYKKEKGSYLSSLLLFNTIVIGGLFFISLPFSGIISEGLGISKIFVYMLFASVFLWMAYNLGTTYLLFHNRYGWMFLVNMCIGPVSQLLAVFLITHMDSDKYMGRIIGIDGFYWVIGAISAVIILIHAKKIVTKEHLKFALTMSIPLVPHLLAQTVLSQSDLLMITYYTGADKAGIYSMAYTIGMVLYTILFQIMNVWSPWVYRRMYEGNVEIIYKYSKIIYFIAFVMAIGLMVISPEAVKIFFADEYQECVYLIPILVVGMYFMFLYLFFYDVEYYHKKTVYIAIASIAASVLNLVLNAIFIPLFGYTAAGYTTAIGYLALLFLHMFFMKKVDKRKIYNLKLMFLVSIMVLLYALAIYWLIDYPIIRYVLLIITLGLVAMRMWREGLEMVKVLRGSK